MNTAHQPTLLGYFGTTCPNDGEALHLIDVTVSASAPVTLMRPLPFQPDEPWELCPACWRADCKATP